MGVNSGISGALQRGFEVMLMDLINADGFNKVIST